MGAGTATHLLVPCLVGVGGVLDAVDVLLRQLAAVFEVVGAFAHVALAQLLTQQACAHDRDPLVPRLLVPRLDQRGRVVPVDLCVPGHPRVLAVLVRFKEERGAGKAEFERRKPCTQMGGVSTKSANERTERGSACRTRTIAQSEVARAGREQAHGAREHIQDVN